MVHSPSLSSPSLSDISKTDRYVQAFALAPSGMFILDVNGRFLDVNDKMAQIFGYTRQEMIGQTIEMVLPERYRSKYFRQWAFLENMQRHQVLGTRRVFYGVRHDGSEIPLGVSISGYDLHKNTLIVGVIADISKHRKFLNQHRGLCQHFKQLLDSSATIIYVVDLNIFQETYISENVTRLLGYSSQEVLKEKNFWYRHLHPDDRNKVMTDYKKQLDCGEGVLEYRFRKKNGDYLWLFDSFRVTRYQDGKPAELLGSWTDISTRKQIEQERDKMAAELHLAQKLEAVGQLASGIGICQHTCHFF